MRYHLSDPTNLSGATRSRFVYKANGSPCEHWPEHLRLNPGSFTSTAGQTSDDWRTTANIDNMPARLGHSHDSTTYATWATEDSWYARLNGTLSPAKASAGATGSTRGGNLT